MQRKRKGGVHHYLDFWDAEQTKGCEEANINFILPFYSQFQLMGALRRHAAALLAANLARNRILCYDGARFPCDDAYQHRDAHTYQHLCPR